VFGASDASYGDPSLVLRSKREGQVMAGWESCRHSCRHRLGIAFSEPLDIEQVNVIEVDTYMHCLNPFRAFCILAYTGTPVDEEALLKALPQWNVTHVPTGQQMLVDDDHLNIKVEEWQKTKPFDLQTVSYSMCLTDSSPWQVLLPIKTLQRDTLHVFRRHRNELRALTGKVSHLMLMGVPDGGIHRIGVYAVQQK
jgi:allantoicase